MATLNVLLAHLLQATFAILYVGSIYVHSSGRLILSPPTTDGMPRRILRGRNEPSVIRTRVIGVSIVSVLCSLAVAVLLREHEERKDALHVLKATLNVLGLYQSSESTFAFLSFLLAPLLYLGPIFSTFLDGSLPLQQNWSFQKHVIDNVNNAQGLRNYLFGPITEEIVFRSCIIGVAKLSGAPFLRTVFLTPLWFGVAHAHHAYETFNVQGRSRNALKMALLMSTFQLAYTTLFGWFTSYVFLRTGSIYPAMAAHIWCNFMGLPGVGQDLKRWPGYSIWIWGTHVAGIVGFGLALAPWTRG